MRVSTFELLVKRIAPTIGIPSVDAPFRRIVQGYFLTISNPSLSRSVTFRLRLTIPTFTGPCTSDARDFVAGTGPANGNHNVAFDVTCTNQFSKLTMQDSTADYKRYRTRVFTLNPGQSCSLQILPNVGNPAVLGAENLEIRGFVEIYQPYGLFNAPPVANLILTPEHRGTVLDNNYLNTAAEPTNNLDFDQVSYALPLASGKAENEVDAVREFLFFNPGLPAKITNIKELIKTLNSELKEEGFTISELKQ